MASKRKRQSKMQRTPEPDSPIMTMKRHASCNQYMLLIDKHPRKKDGIADIYFSLKRCYEMKLWEAMWDKAFDAESISDANALLLAQHLLLCSKTLLFKDHFPYYPCSISTDESKDDNDDEEVVCCHCHFGEKRCARSSSNSAKELCTTSPTSISHLLKDFYDGGSLYKRSGSNFY